MSLASQVAALASRISTEVNALRYNGSTAPSSPRTGQTWLDTSLNPAVLKVWSGTAWVTATPIFETVVARQTATITVTGTTAQDVTGLSITFTSPGPTAVYRIDASTNSQNNLANNNIILAVDLNVDGVANSTPIYHQQQSAVANTGRYTLSYFWLITNLAAGSHTIKMQGRLNAAGSFDLFNSHGVLAIRREK